MSTDPQPISHAPRTRLSKADIYVALASAVAWLLRYVSRYGVGIGLPRWTNRFDQTRYLMSSTAFLHGDLSPEAHHYPLLYPLLSAPFLLIDRFDPYVIPDMALFAITMVAFVRVARRLEIGTGPAIILALAACLLQGRPARAWIDPWTTTLAAALIWWLIDRTLKIVLREGERTDTLGALILLGALAVAIPLTRPADGIVGLVCLALTAGALIVQRRFTPRTVLSVLAGGLAVALPYGALYLVIYGPHLSIYMSGVSAAGFVFSDLPWKTYTLIVSARPWYPHTGSVIDWMPWTLPALAGTLLVLVRGGPARAPLLVLLAVALPYCAIYVTFSDLLPPGMWEFGNLHYFKWLIPLGAAMLWIWLDAFSSRRGAVAAIAALIVVILPTCIRVLPVSAADNEAARMLMFRGDTTRVWNDAFFAKVSIVGDPQGVLWNIGGFHQIPDAAGERAIAIQRLFPPGVKRDDESESPAFPQPQAPYARYRVGLSLGVPCWLHHAACAMPPAR